MPEESIEGRSEDQLPQRPRTSEHVVTEGRSETHAEIRVAVDPERILREYLRKEPVDSRYSQHQNFRELIEARLCHSFVRRRHLTGGGGALQLSEMQRLLIGAKTYDVFWTATPPDNDTMTALLLYEIQHREEWPKRTNHDTQRDMLHFVSSMATGNDRHSQMILEALRALPLPEIKEKMFGRQARGHLNALPFTANIAITRQSEDPEWTQNILERVRRDLFEETGLGNTHRFLTGLFSTYYRPEVLDHVIGLQLAKDPSKVDDLCKAIEPHMKEKRTVPDEILQLWMHHWLPRNSEAGTAMVRHWVLLGESYIRTQYFIAGAPRLCEALRAYQARRQQEQKSALQRKQAQEHAAVDEHVTTLCTSLPKFMIDADIASAAIDDESWQTPHLRTIGQCAVITIPGIAEKQSLESLRECCYGLINASWGKNTEGKQQLERVLSQIDKDIEETIVRTWLAQGTQIRERALQACRAEGTSTEELDRTMENARGLQEWIAHVRDETNPPTALLPLLQEINAALDLHMGNLHRAREDAHVQERKTEMDALSADYLQEDIARKTTYLRELYAAGTGLDLKNAEGHAVHADSGGIASVSMGMSMRQEMKLGQRMEMLHPLDGIYIELGEDPTLEEIKERAAMVNWIAPHEIGHLTDWAMGEKTQKLVGAQREKIDQAVATFEESDRELAGEMIEMEMKECFVDGLGLWLAKSFGVSDPLKDTDHQRLKAILESLCITSEVFQRIVQERATDREMQIRYGFLLLRFMTVCRSILDSTHLQNASGSETRLGEQYHALSSLFQSLCEEIQCFKEETIAHVSKLFRESFEAAGDNSHMNLYSLRHDFQ